jgi:antitoxin MazE
MKTRIVRIGNSQGIRIPKLLLEQCQLPEEVELVVEDNTIVIRPSGKPREGWAEAFQIMAEQGDDELVEPHAPVRSVWDEAEWEW